MKFIWNVAVNLFCLRSNLEVPNYSLGSPSRVKSKVQVQKHIMKTLYHIVLLFQIIEDCEKHDISIFNPELFDLQNVVRPLLTLYSQL